MPSSNAKAGLRPFSPTRFGRYTLLAPLATGGMAQVFLARVTGVEGFEKLVVIKKILAHLAEDAYFVDRFLDEGKIVVKLQHGSIAQVIDMGKEGDEYYIAMEFVDGKDLRKIAARCRDQAVLLPTGLALFVFVRLLDALAYAHRKKDDQDRDLNLVHRDVSPQNILVSYEGEVKVIDFGLAKSAMSLARTSPSVILGKFFYMSPEQARHQPADRRSDLYATGICLWEILAGRNPFDDTPPGEILRVVANPAIPRLRDVCPDVPDALDEVVMRALAPDPAQRFQSAEEMRGRLTSAMLEIDPMAGPESLAAFMRERFEREYDNERRMIAVLSKLPPPPEPVAVPPPPAAAAKVDGEPPPAAAPEGSSRRITAAQARVAAVFETANDSRDVTNTSPTEPGQEADGPITSPLSVGPVFGGAAGGTPRRNSTTKQKAAAAPAGVGAAVEGASDRRSTVKFDPLEFVPDVPAAAPSKPERKAGSKPVPAAQPLQAAGPTPESVTEPRAQRPVSRSRPAMKAVGSEITAPDARPSPEPKAKAEPKKPRAEAAPEADADPEAKAGAEAPPEKPTPPAGVDAPAPAPEEASPEQPHEDPAAPEPPAGPSIIVAQDLAEDGKVQVSPDLIGPGEHQDGPPTPATPLGLPVFSPNVTPRGIDLGRGNNAMTVVLILVGVLCIAAAAIIAVVVFKPAWLGMAPTEAPASSREPEPEPEPDVPGGPKKVVATPPAGTAPSATPTPAAPATAAPAPAPEKVVDESQIEDLPAPPYPKKPSMKKAEMVRWFDDLDSRYQALADKHTFARIARLASAHELMRKKRALLTTPERGAELEVWLHWFEKSLSSTRKKLEK